MNEVYEQYAIIDAKIKEFNDKKDELRTKILEDLVENNIPTLDTPVGKFTISNLKTWKYTKAVEEKSEELKALKAQEESCGDASFEEKPSLRFTQLKF
jgi:hypothetical protein